MLKGKLIIWSKYRWNIEKCTSSYGHGDVLLAWVKYMVKYIHICIMFLMHDKLI